MYRNALNAIKLITSAAIAVSAVPLALGLNVPLLSRIEQWAVYGHLALLIISLVASMVVFGHVVRCAYHNRARIWAYWMRLMREYEAKRR